ncbi:MAG: OmpA family protein [Deltaproteobacteria bacterium]|nr:OmpA family protein [Deltaproteobacteria bacterium]
MKIRITCLFFFIFSLLYPFSLWGGSNYGKLVSDSSQVTSAALESLKKLGAKRGAVTIKGSAVTIKGGVVDIIGFPKGIVGGGTGFSGKVAGVQGILKELNAKVTKREIKIELPSDILFDFDKYNIRPDARESLSKVAKVIKAYHPKSVLIEGHTDSKGSAKYNLRLSLKRANSVKRWLIEKENVRGILFRIKGWGESRPKATNRTAEGRQKNRRVEITIKR